MHRIAPVNLPYNLKTLWFDPGDLEIRAGDKLVCRTTRGLELGVAADDVFEVDDEAVSGLKSPLLPVERIATEEDERQAQEMERLASEAMPVFRRLARETNEEMHPVSVEYMLDGDKAIFYFEAEDRIDFRDLVRKLASEFHVRIDMRQIGVRDEARIVGGIAHCGQIVCCKRLGGEFKPVSIRMAKDQDLSLNPQKISGLCGRLMCCLRYENAAYREFKQKAPKMDAVVKTPAGEGKVVEHDVPRELVAVKVEGDKPVKLPLSAFSFPEGDRKHAVADPAAWDEAIAEAEMAMYETVNLLQLPKFTGEDKLGTAKAVHHESGGSGAGGRRRKKGASAGTEEGSGGDKHRKSRNRSHSSKEGSEGDRKRKPRRRSTKIKAEGGQKETTVAPEEKAGAPSKGQGQKKRRPSRGNRGKGSGAKGNAGAGSGADDAKKQGGQGKLRPGHKSSGLAHDDAGKQAAAGKPGAGGKGASSGANGGQGAPSEKTGGSGRRRRRRRKPSASSQGASGKPASGNGGQQPAQGSSQGGQQ